MHPIALQLFYLFTFAAISPVLAAYCKLSPSDKSWPSPEEWSGLNKSIEGTLLRTIPVASSCYPGNPFDSPYNCSDVTKHWSYAAYHSAWPESTDYSIYSNNSCVPPGADGYSKEKRCSIDGLPQYIVNATTENQVSTAMAWAYRKGIRTVIKSTGHDLGGRSTGAYAISIWTHNFNQIQHLLAWRVPGSNETADVVVAGGGNNWGSVGTVAHQVKRTVVGGEDATVGLGGLILNGGHGLLSSHYGLASDQVLQVTVITTDGRRLVANDEENQDLFWAVRGAGGGQFGVVTEFILKTHPVPASVVTGSLTFYPRHKSNESENASWAALAETVAQIPDLMDTGITGTVTSVTGEQAVSLLGLSEAVPGAAVFVSLTSYNSTTESMNATLHELESQITEGHHPHLNLTLTPPTSQSYWSFTKPNYLASQSAGSTSLLTSRLLGRPELFSLKRENLIDYLQQISVAQDTEKGSMLLFGMQAGLGPANVPEKRRGSVLPAWRTAYAHVMAYGASVNATGDPRQALAAGAQWYETVKEPVWRNWAPSSGAYMNEGNPFTSTWKHDFYGENYDRLLETKLKYDPIGSIFVWSGIGSDMWNYDLHSGLLCRVD
ncbi:NADH-ubiquinone oxidoreductase 20.8 kDa subunit [Penicillium atrosanguineum]|uniref:NADH-ubiquinone oxidoreductase 20.8 kDa subunit n=1 Tax=Penicillium atrosanguineum TaxID=1132637 RepID=UPI00238AEB6C|nr:NADH-ubiquinone oxidoreductase 20.8 kDa subunit [Penicillium atrosanguineum]KAJ5314198.1 NADH-ubiquinone oxidoreductase 20.8 kDa subunit [Penicillium atrosanguineum]